MERFIMDRFRKVQHCECVSNVKINRNPPKLCKLTGFWNSVFHTFSNIWISTKTLQNQGNLEDEHWGSYSQRYQKQWCYTDRPAEQKRVSKSSAHIPWRDFWRGHCSTRKGMIFQETVPGQLMHTKYEWRTPSPTLHKKYFRTDCGSKCQK